MDSKMNKNGNFTLPTKTVNIDKLQIEVGRYFKILENKIRIKSK